MLHSPLHLLLTSWAVYHSCWTSPVILIAILSLPSYVNTPHKNKKSPLSSSSSSLVILRQRKFCFASQLHKRESDLTKQVGWPFILFVLGKGFLVYKYLKNLQYAKPSGMRVCRCVCETTVWQHVTLCSSFFLTILLFNDPLNSNACCPPAHTQRKKGMGKQTQNSRNQEST